MRIKISIWQSVWLKADNWRKSSYYFPASSDLQGFFPVLYLQEFPSLWEPLWPKRKYPRIILKAWWYIDDLLQASSQSNCSLRSTPSYHLAGLPALWLIKLLSQSRPITFPSHHLSFKLHPLTSHASPKLMAWAAELLYLFWRLWKSFNPKHHFCNTRKCSRQDKPLHCFHAGLLLLPDFSNDCIVAFLPLIPEDWQELLQSPLFHNDRYNFPSSVTNSLLCPFPLPPFDQPKHFTIPEHALPLELDLAFFTAVLSVWNNFHHFLF